MSRASAVWEGDREECAGGKEGDSVGCKLSSRDGDGGDGEAGMGTALCEKAVMPS